MRTGGSPAWRQAIARHLRTRAAVIRCAHIALVVGTPVVPVNQGDVLLEGTSPQGRR